MNSKRVALIYDVRSAYDSKVMSGVAAFIQKSANWNVYIEESALKDQRLPNLRIWKGNGIIANLDHPKVAAAVVRSKLPAVGFGSGYGWYTAMSNIPYFFTNNEKISALAAEHLVSLGLRSFAYCGYPKNAINGWSRERQTAFQDSLAERGFSCASYNGTAATEENWISVQRSLESWLQSLPKPVGVMTANDRRGRQLLEACRSKKLRVPEDVAVIGVDNSELLCNLSSPMLSSIEQGARRLGFEAARLLEVIMDGGTLPKVKQFVIDPIDVVARRSTEVLAIEDSVVLKAMAYIAANYANRITAQDVAHSVGVSRSGLEKRFRSALGYTARAAILRFRMERSRHLLTHTRIPLKELANDLGFSTVQHMTTVFHKTFGYPPAKYRNLTH